MPKKLTPQEVLKRIQIKSPEIIGVIESSYTNTINFATFIDKDYGEFSRSPEHLMGKGSSHPRRMAEIRFKKNSLTIEEIDRRLLMVHGDVVILDRSSYLCASKKAIFIDSKYGPWSSIVSAVIRGHGHPQRALEESKISPQEIDKRIDEVHGPIVKIDHSTYSTSHDQATFYDRDYGKWITTVSSVLKGRGHPERGYLIAAKKMDNSSVKIHWKTGQELVCQGGWEPKVVDYLNSNKVEYLWQPKTFRTNILTSHGNISTYRPDLFLIDKNKWIEIKGRIWPSFQLKWDWFKSEYPNSELWDKKKLKEMKIL